MTPQNTINLHLKQTQESHHVLLVIIEGLVIINVSWKRQSLILNNHYHYDGGANGDCDNADNGVD